MSDKKLKQAAIEAALEAGQEMAEELLSMADDIDDASVDDAESFYLKNLCARWESAHKILTGANLSLEIHE